MCIAVDFNYPEQKTRQKCKFLDPILHLGNDTSHITYTVGVRLRLLVAGKERLPVHASKAAASDPRIARKPLRTVFLGAWGTGRKTPPLGPLVKPLGLYGFACGLGLLGVHRARPTIEAPISSFPSTTHPPLPPLAQIRKPADVEDPININVNRPLAYAFVKLVYPTAMTPNQVTYLATLVGLSAAAAWFVGTPVAMAVGGLLLWTSAILDGADGELARARRTHSQFGRALDGFMDMVVALASLAAGFTHVWLQTGQAWVLWLSVPLTLASVAQILSYDFYKESFLRLTNPHSTDNESVAQMDALGASLADSKAPWQQRALVSFLRGAVNNENWFVKMTNPAGRREGLSYTVTPETAAVYRKHNLGPMRALWRWMGLAPHTYLISIFAMFDRLDIYLWLRLVLFNVLFAIVLYWQRRASAKTLEELEAIGQAPVPTG